MWAGGTGGQVAGTVLVVGLVRVGTGVGRNHYFFKKWKDVVTVFALKALNWILPALKA